MSMKKKWPINIWSQNMKCTSKKNIFFVLLSLSLHLGNHSQARDLILIENLGTSENAELTLKLMREKFKIPKSLITYRMITGETTCRPSPTAIMHFCLKKNGELDIIRVNQYILDQSLKSLSDGLN